ncbi:MAG: RNase adapter RapZ [Clostridia bacterium]|nr:RNase adapter RapZ [Clostridia bacterium]
MKYLIVTGQSGAGKTACVRYLEDKGNFCIDNIPPIMIPRLIEAFDSATGRYSAVAIGVDVRSGEFFDAQAVSGLLRELNRLGHSIQVIFMEASDDTLLNRYKETRRDHPLCQEGMNLTQAIAEEKNRLQPLREVANYIIDTTGMNSQALKKALNDTLGEGQKEVPIRVDVMSFGFKRGLPRQADLVADVRFLPNPFYIEKLRPHTGRDADVRDFVMDHPVTAEFMQKWKDLLSFLIPHYKEEGKHRLVIAIGCSGGVHRSVAIAEAIGSFLQAQGYPTEVSHRDMLLEQSNWITPRDGGES